MPRILFTISLGLLRAGCSTTPRETHAAATGAALAVDVVPVATEDWTSNFEASGTVRARTTGVVAARMMGYVREVRVNTGDRVRSGQTLVVLDARDLDTSAQRAEEGMAEARSAIPEAEQAIAGAKANLDLAQSTFARMEQLYSKKSISNQEFDEASARRKSATAAYDMARARRTQLDARVRQAEQEVKAAGIARSYSEIAAPFSGIVVSKSVEPGNLAAPGAALMTIEQEGSYRLEANVGESQLGSIRVGQIAQAKVESLDRIIDARVAEIVPAVDPATRTGVVKLDLPAMAGIRSGIFGRAIFSGAPRHVMAIPAGAVRENGQLQSVFVASDGIARTRLVTTGEKRGGRVEVLSGLSDGDRVISPIPASIEDGARVEPKR